MNKKQRDAEHSRTTRRWGSRGLFLLAALLLVQTVVGWPARAAGAAVIRYDIFRLPVPAGFSGLTTRAVNDSGTVVGWLNGDRACRSVFNAATGAWVTTALGPVQGGLDGPSQALDVNDAGVIVGTVDSVATFPPTRPFVWDSAEGMRDLNDLLAPADRHDPATGSGWILYEAYAINNGGQVVGAGDLWVDGVDTCDFFLLSGLGSGTVTLQPFALEGYFWPRDLNDAASTQVAGRMSQDNGGSVTLLGAVWENGVSTPFPGQTSQDPSRINNLGAVAGYSYSRRGFLWSPGDAAPLLLQPQRSSGTSRAEALNDARQVVGWGNPGSGARAGLWENGSGVFVDLKTLTNADKKWTLFQGTAISNAMKNGTALYIAGGGSYGTAGGQGFILRAR